ncbi:MAG: S8 family serine peptidase [Gemmatimonadales bacterium]|nr:S8 family serine peptidase [Gemmatimonadales bacterium]MYG20385.1 S8 family serine peptidase [Gemmatimonadales bacterium]MYL06464.1 S8 family serine peptidase [Gemmatimonadales bacterium]
MDRVRAALGIPEDISVSGKGVRVAVIDTGVDATHPDLDGRIDLNASKNYGLTRGLDDYAGHGTHIAGIIAGDGKLSDGRLRGIAPAATLIVLKAVPANGAQASDFVAEAALDAIDAGADVINYSGGRRGHTSPPWSWSASPDVITQAFRVANDAGVLCVAAAGNEGPAAGTINRPAIDSSVLAVGALSTDGRVLANGSSRGPVHVDHTLPAGGVDSLGPNSERVDYTKPDVVVPAWNSPPGPGRLWMGPVSTRSSFTEALVGVDPTDRSCPYAPYGGTSQAAPVVCGVAALLIEYAARLGFDWGDNRAESLRRLICFGARFLRGYDQDDQGAGIPYWPAVASTLEDCLDNPNTAALVHRGPQLEAFGAPPSNQ